MSESIRNNCVPKVADARVKRRKPVKPEARPIIGGSAGDRLRSWTTSNNAITDDEIRVHCLTKVQIEQIKIRMKKLLYPKPVPRLIIGGSAGEHPLPWEFDRILDDERTRRWCMARRQVIKEQSTELQRKSPHNDAEPQQQQRGKGEPCR